MSSFLPDICLSLLWSAAWGYPRGSIWYSLFLLVLWVSLRMSSTDEQLAELVVKIKKLEADIAKYQDEITIFEQRIRDGEDEDKLRGYIGENIALIKSIINRLTGLESDMWELAESNASEPSQPGK